MLNSEFSKYYLQNSPLIEVKFNGVEVFPVFSCPPFPIYIVRFTWKMANIVFNSPAYN